jgi:hypothetical protein
MDKYYYYVTRLTRAYEDLLESKDNLEAWLDKDNILSNVNDYRKHTIEYALLFSAFMAYGRVFNKSRIENENYNDYIGSEFSKVRNQIKNNFTEEQLNLHEYIIKERNGSFAHSDGTVSGHSIYVDEDSRIYATSRNAYGGIDYQMITLFQEIVYKAFDEIKNIRKEVVSQNIESFK